MLIGTAGWSLPREAQASFLRDRFPRSIALEPRSSAAATPAWCIFDNTTLGEATSNALYLQATAVGPKKVDRRNA